MAQPSRYDGNHVYLALSLARTTGTRSGGRDPSSVSEPLTAEFKVAHALLRDVGILGLVVRPYRITIWKYSLSCTSAQQRKPYVGVCSNDDSIVFCEGDYHLFAVDDH